LSSDGYGVGAVRIVITIAGLYQEEITRYEAERLVAFRL
jgi:hypothetical protein